MTKDDFQLLLMKCTRYAVEFAKNYVKMQLPDEILYIVKLNCSMDNNCHKKFRTYPEDESRVYNYITVEDVVQLLVRDSGIPVWIDISAFGIHNNKTIVELLCAGRFTDDSDEFYYKSREQGPFGIKSPSLPVVAFETD